MLLEIILYFFLGFLAALLLVLLVAPAIWNRAVVLTKRKVENSLPLSLNEIQAEKDRLRAEYAMTTRRLELGIEDLRKKASEQVVELHSKRDEANRLNHAKRENLIKIEALEKASEAMRGKLQEDHEKIEELTGKYSEASEQLAAVKSSYEEVRSKHSETQESLNKAKIDLVASESKIDSLSGTLSTVNLTDEERTAKIQSLHEQIAELKASLKEEKQQGKKAASELKIVSKKLQSAEQKLEKQSGTRKSANANETKLQSEVSDLTNKLINENAKVISLEAKLAQYMLKDDITENKNEIDFAALDSLKGEGSALASEIKSVNSAHNSTGESDSETRSALKERIRTLAAKTVVATGNHVENPSDAGDTQSKTEAPSLAKRIEDLQTSKNSRR